MDRFTDPLVLCLQPDAVGLFFFVLTGVLFLLVSVFALSYTEHDGHRGRFYLFLVLTFLALAGLAFAGNLFTFYLFFEVMSIVSFPLVLHGGSLSGRRAAVTYFGFSVFGATLALGGMFLLGGAGMGTFLPGGLSLPAGTRYTLSALLMLAGFSCKAGLMPLSNWLPTAHPEAPAPASALLSGVITKAGMLGVIRVVYFVFGPEALRGTFAQRRHDAIGLATIFMGSMLAYREKVLKKRLAFSSVSQLSYVVLGLVTMNLAAFTGALLQMAFHAAAKVGLFLCAGAIQHRTGYTRVEELSGVGKRMPGTMLCFGAFSLSLVGIPPFGGFAAKWSLAEGALQQGGTIGTAAVIVLLVSALLTAGYLLPIVGDGFFRQGDGFKKTEADGRMLWPMVLLAAFVLLVGAFPGGLTACFDRIGYALLGGAG